MKFKTESGSWYVLNRTETLMSWARISTTTKSGGIRKEGGRLVEWPIIEIGKPAMLFDDAIQPGCVVHAVHTSRVTKIVLGVG